MTELVESGIEPEFFITDIVRTEVTGGGTALRLFIATARDDHMLLRFTVVASLADLAKMAKQVLDIAGGRHDLPYWLTVIEPKAH